MIRARLRHACAVAALAGSAHVIVKRLSLRPPRSLFNNLSKPLERESERGWRPFTILLQEPPQSIDGNLCPNLSASRCGCSLRLKGVASLNELLVHNHNHNHSSISVSMACTSRNLNCGTQLALINPSQFDKPLAVIPLYTRPSISKHGTI